MKKHLLFMLAGLLLVALVSTKPVTRTDPQDPKKVSHIKMVTINDGKKTVIDTTITGKNVWTITQTGDKNFEWVTLDNEQNLDSLKKVIELKGKDGKEKKIIIMKHDGGNGPVIIRELESEGDSFKRMTMHLERAGRGKRMMMAPLAPGVPIMGRAPVYRYRQNQRGNIINLSDPGVISFKKEKLSGGREKITIIRNEVKENEETFNVRVNTEGDAVKESIRPKIVRGYELKKAPVEKNVEIEIINEPVKK
jgi:hypothetical protein